MFNFRKTTLFLSILAVLASVSTQPMGQFARKAFPKACTGLYWTMLGAQCVGTVVNNVNEESEKRKHLYAANPQVTEFANNEFKKIGVTQPIQIKVHYHTHAFKDFVVISQNEHTALRMLLEAKEEYEKNPPANAQAFLDSIDQELLKYQFLLQHEGGHIKHNHLYKGIAATAAAPFALHFGLKKLKNSVATQAKPTLLKSALKLPAGIACIAASQLIASHLIFRPGEQQADNGVTNDKQLLHAASNFMKEAHTEETARLKNMPWFKKYFSNATDKQVEQIMSVVYGLNDTHPHPLRRASKFEARIKKLEEQEQTPQA